MHAAKMALLQFVKLVIVGRQHEFSGQNLL
jgi:hypothetical protein